MAIYEFFVVRRYPPFLDFLMNLLSHMYRSVHTEPIRTPCLFSVSPEHLNVFPSAQRGFRYLLLILPGLGKQNGMSSRSIDALYTSIHLSTGIRFELDFNGGGQRKHTERVIFRRGTNGYVSKAALY